ncbi:MAG: CinA family protein [Bdellovibrionales bacterium]
MSSTHKVPIRASTESYFIQVSFFVQKISDLFLARGLTLAVAESCTGGLLSAAIASRPGVSKFYLGGVVSYHRSVKNEILGVPLSLIQVLGEVSEPVAREMASGVRAALKSDWAVAVTGVAGPSGGTVDKPVGMVCFSVVGPGGFSLVETKYFSGAAISRVEIQNKSVQHALEMLLNAFENWSPCA